MANEVASNTGYGYAPASSPVAAQIFAISNGLVINVAFVQSNGLAGAWCGIPDGQEWEWDGRILPTVADCEAELNAMAAGKPAVSVA